MLPFPCLVDNLQLNYVEILLCSQEIKKSSSQIWISLKNKNMPLSLKAVKLLIVVSISYYVEKTSFISDFKQNKEKNQLEAE